MANGSAMALLRTQGIPWLGSTPYDDVIWGSRLTVSRNLRGQPFPRQATADQRQATADAVADALPPHCADWQQWSEEAILPPGGDLLAERGLWHGQEPTGAHRLWVAPGEQLAVVTNDGDAVRLVGSHPELNLADLWGRVGELEARLGERLAWAFDDRWGYLTANPEEAGTGLVAGVLLHLPGLVLADRLAMAERAAAQLRLRLAQPTLTGTTGQLYWLQNATCRGEAEDAVVSRLSRVATELAIKERQARRCLLEQQRALVLDVVGRAYGVLRHARTVAAEEALMLLSALQLGLELRLLQTVDRAGLRRMWQETRPAHLAAPGAEAEPEGELRAHRLRAWLSAAAGGLA